MAITPLQASQSLNIPQSTLRRYASRFKKFISDQLGKNRSYTLEDIEIFRRIREMSESGLSLDQIDELLPLANDEIESKALLALPDFTQALELARSKVAQLEQALIIQEEKIQEQEERLARLEKHLNSSMLKRVFTKPKEND